MYTKMWRKKCVESSTEKKAKPRGFQDKLGRPMHVWKRKEPVGRERMTNEDVRNQKNTVLGVIKRNKDENTYWEFGLVEEDTPLFWDEKGK